MDERSTEGVCLPSFMVFSTSLHIFITSIGLNKDSHHSLKKE